MSKQVKKFLLNFTKFLFKKEYPSSEWVQFRNITKTVTWALTDNIASVFVFFTWSFIDLKTEEKKQKWDGTSSFLNERLCQFCFCFYGFVRSSSVGSFTPRGPEELNGAEGKTCRLFLFNEADRRDGWRITCRWNRPARQVLVKQSVFYIYCAGLVFGVPDRSSLRHGDWRFNRSVVFFS